MLGERGVTNDDASYTGDTGGSVWSMQYYRNKASEYQAVLQGVDQTAAALREVAESDPFGAMGSEAWALLSEFDARKWTMKVTAEAINAGAALVNSAGGRFPQLSIPAGLGVAPIVFPAASVAAVAAAATLIVWGVQWIGAAKALLSRYLTLDAIEDPQVRAIVAERLERIELAEQTASNPLSDIAGIVKWVAIGAAVFIAYKVATDSGLFKRSKTDDAGDD